MLLQINDIKINVAIGIYAWEQSIKRRLCIDLCFDFDKKLFLDYDVIFFILKSELLNKSFALVEECAVYLLNIFKARYPDVFYYKVVVKKLAICNFFPDLIIEKSYCKKNYKLYAV